MRRLCSLLVLVVLAVSCAAFAQTSAPFQSTTLQPVPVEQRATTDDIHNLFAALHVEKQTEQMMNVVRVQMTNLMEQELKKTSPPPTARQLQLFKESMDQAMGSLDVRGMMNDMANIYQQYLTRDEVVAITAFYESPAGQSMLTKMPAIVSEYMRVAMPKQMDKVRVTMEKLEQQIKKEQERQSAPKND